MKTQKPILIRLVNSIQVVNGCWEWQLGKSKDGYGQTFTWDGNKSTTVRAHRLSYEAFTGEKIPPGFVIDHLCRNIVCINPDHLDVVTPKVNTQRGKVAQPKTHCLKGHELTPNNLVTWNNSKTGKVTRLCRKCKINRLKSYRLKRR